MAKLSLLILAGGRSRRMGQDKLWMMLDGVPLVERGVRNVLPLAGEVLFCGRGEALQEEPGWVETGSGQGPSPLHALADRLTAEGVPARVVPDIHPGAGPLAGLHAGLTAARYDLILALAADMPFVNLTLIEAMISMAAEFDAVVPRLAGPDGELAWEPLHALYRRSCLPAVAARLAAGERRANSFLPDVRVRGVTHDEIAIYDPELRSFFNVNTPEDWEALRDLTCTSHSS